MRLYRNNLCTGLLSLALLSSCFCHTAVADVVYAQTQTETSGSNGSSDSDSDAFNQKFDDLTLATGATVRSVTWWGQYGGSNKTPVAPFTFQLIFYADSGGLPDMDQVLSSTTVEIASLSPPVESIPGSFGDTVYYEFRADITPTMIPAGTKVWFSVFADTSNDLDDSFLWREDSLSDSIRRNNNSGVFSVSENSRPLFILYDRPVRPVTTLYADDFSESGVLDGSEPDTRPGTETWTASADWLADGTTPSVDSTSEDDSAFLPFTPLPGKIYTLSATLEQPTGGYSVWSTDAWAGIGFTAGNDTNSLLGSSNDASPSMIVTRNGNVRTYSGPGSTGSESEDIYDDRRIIKIVLDTTTAPWTAEWLVGIRSLRQHNFTSNPSITHIAIAREDGTAVDFDSLSLTVEDGDTTPGIAPRIVAFVRVAENTWELEIAGEPGMPFELRSSIDLDFSPGNLVENLSQANPGTDPGTISGDQNEIVTTDASGSAKIRFNFSGEPRNFVRAVSLP